MAIAVERTPRGMRISMDEGEMGPTIGGLARVGGGPLGQRWLADRDTGELIDEDEDDEGAGPPTPEELYAAYRARLVADMQLSILKEQVKGAKTELEIASADLFGLLHRLRQGRA